MTRRLDIRAAQSSLAARDQTVQPASDFGARCLALDLEVGKADGRIHKIAAVRGDDKERFVFGSGNLTNALAELEKFAEGAAMLVGHNIVAFDLPRLVAVQPSLRLLALPVIDTLQISPLAFPRNPYHHLVKHYQDAQLKRGRINDPELDARLSLELIRDEQQAFCESDERLLLCWHWLTGVGRAQSGLDLFFSTIRQRSRPSSTEAQERIASYLSGRGCQKQIQAALTNTGEQRWELAYAMAWLSVSGGDSVMPPWVRHQFPGAARMVRALRDRPCGDAGCSWCRERHNPLLELKRWFGFESFRSDPVDTSGQPLQQAIAEAAMRGEHVLAILPTGTGKSLCYQLPALSRYEKTGALTVVISPLVALMADQVAGLEARGVTSCAALNGLLSMPERADVLDRIRLGGIGILILSPEQLRNRSLRRALAQREIAAWVLDEAHCLSKWGHDFRPDYRYVGRFISERADDLPIPPVLCLTATAKPDVIAEIQAYFETKAGLSLKLFDGGASRTNLAFSVVPTTVQTKFADIGQLLAQHLPSALSGGAIVYCATRSQTEDVAVYLRELGLEAAHFHAGLRPETKKDTQFRFGSGDIRVIVATNAFGMGIDKPDVRVVIHADIPGSLENYLQEAGRAGRDRQAAQCILMYTPEDVESQFGMTSRARLNRHEIQAILKSLRRLRRRNNDSEVIVATAGEILTEEEDGRFLRDSITDDSRVRTAVCWLEEAELLSREENRVQVFPSSLRVQTVEQARAKLGKCQINEPYRRQLLKLVETLIGADVDDGISTDELMNLSGLSASGVCRALYDLEQLGVASNDTALTVFLHKGTPRASDLRFEESAAIEVDLIGAMREAAPELDQGERSILQLRRASQRLKDAGHKTALPTKLLRILKSIAADGRDDEGGKGSLDVRSVDAETVAIRLRRDWHSLERTAELRRLAAKRVLEQLLNNLPEDARGTDLLSSTTMGELHAAIKADLFLRAEVRDPPKLVDRALLWLHEQEVIRLNKGLTVFRPAMSIRLSPEKRKFAKSDFAPLQLHYHEQTLQIHVMAEYVQRGLETMADALRMTMDYFSRPRAEFMQRWLPDREQELARQTTPESWAAIVESLRNPVQQRIVADRRERTNVLVLAGPGSGKTRVLVHRIAYLIRVRRENPRGVLALAYNRHAAVEIRSRLADLIGKDAKGVTVLTCHALAMRLVGVSFADRRLEQDDRLFSQVLTQATALLNGEGLPPTEADELRERLLGSFRWILVDEYQDVGPEQYALISALAGRTRRDKEARLSLFAVGDDDQNIYAFHGASVEYIRRFTEDYTAKPTYLVENYRSSARIITAANLLMALARQRMKVDHPIRINRHRNKDKPGGEWETRDPVGMGRVQILPGGTDFITQAIAVMTELQRLASLDPNWDWRGAGVIARAWRDLDPIRSFCEMNGIPVHLGSEEVPSVWRLRETQQLVRWLEETHPNLVKSHKILAWVRQQTSSRWWQLIEEAVSQYQLETAETELPSRHFRNWLAEWGREVRRRPTGLQLLTAHRAKGLEFKHVVVLDGSWGRVSRGEDRDASRRLYYVAMTRAQETLTLVRGHHPHAFLDGLPKNECFQWRTPAQLPLAPKALSRRYQSGTPGDVDLSFSGRHGPTHPIHRAIASISAGDSLQLSLHGELWELQNLAGTTVGRLAKRFRMPPNTVCTSVRATAVIERRREDSTAEYAELLRVDHWEVIVPEFVFEPQESANQETER